LQAGGHRFEPGRLHQVHAARLAAAAATTGFCREPKQDAHLDNCIVVVRLQFAPIKIKLLTAYGGCLGTESR
jgi:hypothetical protein